MLTRNTLAHLYVNTKTLKLNDESYLQREVCLPCTATLAIILDIVLFHMDLFIFPSAVARSETEETIVKRRRKSILFAFSNNGATAAVPDAAAAVPTRGSEQRRVSPRQPLSWKGSSGIQNEPIMMRGTIQIALPDRGTAGA